ncbi:MAG: SRPBCC family protein [Flavobacteriales bacterium]|nr:SRPBCC family protein [Flavobacteriales bacterium]
MSTKVEIVPHGDRAIRITRTFQAPRTMVFDAMTTADRMLNWFHGAPGWTLVRCEIDLRVGGTYRWVWRNADGQEMGMGGMYKEIVRPERLVTTEKFDQAWYPGEAVGTMVLTEEGGRTLMTLTVEYESPTARDGVLAAELADGMEFGYQRLDQFLWQR